MNAIEVRGLTKAYRDFTLNGLSFELPEGCILGLVGENGAGKTTTMRLLLGMTKPDGGEAVLFIKRDSGRVPGAHLQTHEGETEPFTDRAQPPDQRIGDPLAAPGKIGRDIGDIALIQHIHHPHITENRAVRADGGDEFMLCVLYLPGQLLCGPGQGEAALFDLYNLRDVVRSHIADRVFHQCASAQL